MASRVKLRTFLANKYFVSFYLRSTSQSYVYQFARDLCDLQINAHLFVYYCILHINNDIILTTSLGRNEGTVDK